MESVQVYLKEVNKLKVKKDFEGAANMLKLALNRSAELNEFQPIETWL